MKAYLRNDATSLLMHPVFLTLGGGQRFLGCTISKESSCIQLHGISHWTGVDSMLDSLETGMFLTSAPQYSLTDKLDRRGSKFYRKCRSKFCFVLIGRNVDECDRTAKHVTTFVREPAWISPTQGMDYHEYTAEEKEIFKNQPEKLVSMRKDFERKMSGIFPIYLSGSTMQEQTRYYMTQQMQEKINNDYLSSKLIPDFGVGCRRLTVRTISPLILII